MSDNISQTTFLRSKFLLRVNPKINKILWSEHKISLKNLGKPIFIANHLLVIRLTYVIQCTVKSTEKSDSTA